MPNDPSLSSAGAVTKDRGVMSGGCPAKLPPALAAFKSNLLEQYALFPDD